MNLFDTVKSVSISAPSRLHFGLISIGDQTERKFGGAGLMIDHPRTCVSVSAARRLTLSVDATVRESGWNAIRLWHERLADSDMRKVSIDELPVGISIEAVPRHHGLGSGTQLAFSIACCLQMAFGQPIPSTEEMAIALDRGRRSAIGSYGFFKGGFLVDRGIVDESVAPLDLHVEFPTEWKIALMTPAVLSPSVHGVAEAEAFENLPATNQNQADELAGLLKQRIVPSVLGQDFSTFAKSVTDFGRKSGTFYSQIQGGSYASPQIESLVNTIGSLGEFAVGQSSWGPTVFAICPSESAAESLITKVTKQSQIAIRKCSIVSADNSGMRIR